MHEGVSGLQVVGDIACFSVTTGWDGVVTIDIG